MKAFCGHCRTYREVEKCEKCKGTGTVKIFASSSQGGPFWARVQCPCCKGKGYHELKEKEVVCSVSQ